MSCSATNSRAAWISGLIGLSRYLRARRFVPQDAFVQFKDTEIWRKDNKLEELYELIDIQDYQEARSVVSLEHPFPSIRNVWAEKESIHNGLVDGISVGCRCICMKWAS